MANLANTMNKVKILVIGDSGVGKTSLVHLISQGEVLGNSSWTIGCSVEVCVHQHREGTPHQRPFFVELWDVGGSGSHRNARHVFYSAVHGIILTHDLTNRKSQGNLHRWLAEVLLLRDNNTINTTASTTTSATANTTAAAATGGGGGVRFRPTPLVEDFDAENFGGFAQVYGCNKVPVLVVGTKLDLLGAYTRYNRGRRSTIAEECAADEINVNTQDPRSLAPGSSNAVKLSRFIDKVIDKQTMLRGEAERETPYSSSYSSYSYSYSYSSAGPPPPPLVPPPPSSSSSSSSSSSFASTRRAKTSFSSVSHPLSFSSSSSSSSGPSSPPPPPHLPPPPPSSSSSLPSSSPSSSFYIG